MHISELREENELVKIFCDLVEIPSPSLSEDKVINWISEYLNKHKIYHKLDSYKNVIIKIPPTDKSKQPILLSAHMDVVGDFSPINLSMTNNFIETDKKRTLGADNKAGVAISLLFATELSRRADLKHGGLEIVLTRDEEHGMSGIKNLDYSQLESKYVLVLDADKLGQILVSGASYTNAKLKVTTPIGGHSGLDIGDNTRLNAVKLIAELVNNIPQGVYYADETGTITSINLGCIIGGNIQNIVSKILAEKVLSEDYSDYFIENSVTNVINTKAQASYSIRSANKDKEEQLKNQIKNEVLKFNIKYQNLAKAEVEFALHLPPFEKSMDKTIPQIHTKVCEDLNIKQTLSSFHAGAETHIYAQNSNANGEKFMPYLIGMADIFNMHSTNEMIDYTTLLKGYEILKEMFVEFNK